ncbi:MAG: hypothetical protein HY978_00515 [Candidatus Liptonbacteria bacterium]|nr:hypothetical protein [Candidatus Liptonbacteria bacterium]
MPEKNGFDRGETIIGQSAQSVETSKIREGGSIEIEGTYGRYLLIGGTHTLEQNPWFIKEVDGVALETGARGKFSTPEAAQKRIAEHHKGFGSRLEPQEILIFQEAARLRKPLYYSDLDAFGLIAGKVAVEAGIILAPVLIGVAELAKKVLKPAWGMRQKESAKGMASESVRSTQNHNRRNFLRLGIGGVYAASVMDLLTTLLGRADPSWNKSGFYIRTVRNLIFAQKLETIARHQGGRPRLAQVAGSAHIRGSRNLFDQEELVIGSALQIGAKGRLKILEKARGIIKFGGGNLASVWTIPKFEWEEIHREWVVKELIEDGELHALFEG